MTSLSPLRLRIGVAALALFVACGGESSTSVTPTPPPPPPPTPVATTVVVATGDGQQADIGTALSVRPTVVVRDATGSVMAGVAVLFAVDSGGGTLTATAATTGTDGSASSGNWTLGSAVGPNVVSATVSGLPAVRFRALALLPRTRTLLDTLTIAAGGGTVRYQKSGDPLSGLSLTVPARSFPTATTWTIRADSTIVVPLPPDFAQVGPVLVISNGQGYADSLLTVTTPMRVADTDAVAPFYFDPTSQTLEPIPMVNRTDSSATLATRHFSNDMLALPRNAPVGSALRTARAVGFGDVQVVWVRIARSRLVGTFTSSFRPGFDDWEFVKYGEYISPNGTCAGMSITAMYYHYFQRAAGQPTLFHRYDKSLANQWDNLQGIRFAGSVQGDYEFGVSVGVDPLGELVKQGVARGTKVEDLTATWILLTLKLSKRPVYLALYSATVGHAVVAYAATRSGERTSVSFADPNFPGASRVMSFEAGVLSPVTLQQNASATADAFGEAYAMAVSADVDMGQLSRRWVEFTQQRAGSDRYPGTYRYEVFNGLTNSWSPLGDTVRTTASSVLLRFICPTCPVKTVGGAVDEQQIEIWNAEGSRLLEDGKEIKVTPGTTTLMAIGKAFSKFYNSTRRPAGFVDAKPFVVIARPFKIAAEFTHAPPTVDLDFSAPSGGIGGEAPKFRWDFGDGTPAVLKTADSTVTHHWTRYGTFMMKVELRDVSGALVAKDSMQIKINNRAAYMWTLEEATVESTTLPAEGIGRTRADTLIFQKFSGWITRLRSNPNDNTLLVIGRAQSGATCNAVAYIQEDPTAADTLIHDGLRGIVGSCGDADYTGNLTLAPRRDGALTGLAVPVPQQAVLVLPGGSINAVNTRTGFQSMTGEFVLNVRYSTGLGGYRVSFKAIGLIEDP